MGYQKANGRWAATRVIDLNVVNGEFGDPAPAAVPTTKTITVNGASVELGDCTQVRLTLNVTAASGTTPTLDVKLQGSPDGATWVDITGATFAQKTVVASERKVFVGIDRFVRAVYTIAGTTPSFTYTLAGEAVSG
jgi:hypothetical protein